MTSRRITLNDVIGFRPRRLSDLEWSEIERQERTRALGKKLGELASSIEWATVRSGVLERAEQLLDVPLLDVMRWAWNKSRDLKAYRDRTKYPPDRTFGALLAEHKITSVHKPYVELRVGDQLVGRVGFSVEIGIVLKGAKLEIQGGRIKKIHTGECRATGSFSCEGFVLAKREFARLDLPGTIDLGEGVEI